MDRVLASRFLLIAFLSSLALPVLAQTAAAIAYAPIETRCPSGSALVRTAGTGRQSLSSQEAQYVATRKSSILPDAWSSYLTNVQANAKAHSIDLPEYVSHILGAHTVPDGLNVGIATSGGGYRAAIFGAGILNALDGRNVSSVKAGTGGLLQGATYLSGLSGGAWLVSSLVQANFPLLPNLIFGTDSDNSAGESKTFGGWLAQFGIVEASTNVITEAEFIDTLVDELTNKHAAGFGVTITDLWARTLSRHFVNGTTSANFFNTNVTHGAGLLWSGVPKLPLFSQHAHPFPILISDSVSKNENITDEPPQSSGVPLSNVIYEINPFEFGSFDPMLSAFIPTQLMGSSNGTCFTGFDQTAFVAGLSSSLFNAPGSEAAASALLAPLSAAFPQPTLNLLEGSVPNPFIGVSPKTFLDSNQSSLSLVDGGEDGETIPIQPLLVKARGVDVIVVIDAAADTSDDFSDGSSMIATQERVAQFTGVYTFPPIPTTADKFTSEGLTKRPTFFGCENYGDAPLVIYLANGAAPLGQDPVTNTSTLQLTYEADQLQQMLDQINDIATQGIPVSTTQKDPQWASCLACAVVDRARDKAGTARSGVCPQCFTRYCWNGQ